MDSHSFLATNFRVHYKKLLLLATASLTVYLIKKYMDKRKKSKEAKKEKKKIKEFPTIEEIQKFIEDLPFDAVNANQAITLKDLLGELSEFSEDEEWKELIASVHNMYEDNTVKVITEDETDSIMSIYEDPNVITLHGTPSKDVTMDKMLCDNKDDRNISKGEGDRGTTSLPSTSEREQETNTFEMLPQSAGDGDKSKTEKPDDSSVVF